MQTGKVYLVGAGPGDPGLLTLKAKECLQRADIVIYDNLANDELLTYVPPQATRVYVGKKAGQHTLKQPEINRLLVESAQMHDVVVRLKGGDPFLFGRGGEEALELVAQDIPFEVVPGISSGVAAATYAGIPVTHRELSASVAFITGHESPHKAPGSASVNWQRMAESCDTLVIFMGVKNLPNIVRELLDAGISEAMPVAVIREGTYNSQRTITGTLRTIVPLVTEHNLTPPAIIVIGKVVALRVHLSWFENRPLFGQTIVITRNLTSESTLATMLEAQGAHIFCFPTIDIVEIRPNKDLETALARLDQYDWLLFTSGNAVRIFFDRLLQQHDIRALKNIRIAAIGKPSAVKLRDYHLKADFI
ncbi:uroporphyrinogen-III C-methyltransferase, partial [candidate division KSB3 bacterium]|nr:uroporphyrinogen-III C-methyltransferase [candidate division KSB3 bacterium]MBD3326915.1 uroporphyrinogen-III C-methyltransferase [candidate division KSB3 bacterium]